MESEKYPTMIYNRRNFTVPTELNRPQKPQSESGIYWFQFSSFFRLIL